MIQIIVHAFMEKTEAVVEVAFASTDKALVEATFAGLQTQFPDDYLAIYDLPLDTDLTTLPHYPSVAISLDDFKTE